ncbi:MAG: TetR family transcriptional regulator, partial [Planctomycetes bacterium]|nr:TetR family transcriptional regulator [Planctomycetota bacterium]
MVARAISRPTIPADRALARADAIVAAAAATFARFGLKRTQMADIAAAAAVALGTLYRYSRSKEALFGAALRLALHAPRPEIEAALADPAPSRAAIERFFAA